MRNFLSVEQFDNEGLLNLLKTAIDFKEGRRTYQSDATVVNMFLRIVPGLSIVLRWLSIS